MNLSERKIKIDGKEYTLFLNRQGIVAWEKYSLFEQEKLREMREKYSDILTNNVEIKDDTNPFAGLDDYEDDAEVASRIIEKMYWIMLYTNHKLSYNQVHELYNKAVKEYGEEQLSLLVDQMIDDVNTNPDKNSNEEPKKLEALNQTK